MRPLRTVIFFRSRLVKTRDLAIVVAAYRWCSQLPQGFKRFARPEWPRNAVAKINNHVSAMPANIRENGFMGKDVAMNVCDDGDTQSATLSPVPLPGSCDRRNLTFSSLNLRAFLIQYPA